MLTKEQCDEIFQQYLSKGADVHWLIDCIPILLDALAAETARADKLERDMLESTEFTEKFEHKLIKRGAQLREALEQAIITLGVKCRCCKHYRIGASTVVPTGYYYCARQADNQQCDFLFDEKRFWPGGGDAKREAVADTTNKMCTSRDIEIGSLEAERDRWKARAEALERALIRFNACASCVHNINAGNAQRRKICKKCKGWSSDPISPSEWHFDEARFAPEGSGTK